MCASVRVVHSSSTSTEQKSYAALRRAVHDVVTTCDVAQLAPDDACVLLGEFVAAYAAFGALISRVEHRAVTASTHQRSTAQRVAQIMGESVSSVNATVKLVEELQQLPEVEAQHRVGELSRTKTQVIAQAVEGDTALASELLAVAPRLSVKQLLDHATELRLRGHSAAERRHKQRRAQYVSITRAGDFFKITGQILPENAMWIPQFHEVKRAMYASADPCDIGRSALIAEAFSDRVGSGFGCQTQGADTRGNPVRVSHTRPEICFHVDVTAIDGTHVVFDDVTTAPGLGPMPTAALGKFFDDVAVSVVGSVNKQAKWFMECTGVSLPERTRRAISRAQRDLCNAPGCHQPVTEIDHRTPRSQRGSHHAENLQGLCSSCHAAKTVIDAPFTAERFYDRQKPDKLWRESG